MRPAEPLVSLHLWGVDRVLPALTRVATDRFRLRSVPGLRFAKILGTGSGETFTPRDADPHHWALLLAWSSDADRARFMTGPVARAWDALAHERLDVVLRSLGARGTWSRRAPFAVADASQPPSDAVPGPVAALTRARLTVRRMPTFWRAVPPVVADLVAAPGLRLSIGVGEAPIGLQGTFSLWSGHEALTAFAYGSAAHRDAVRRTAEVGWYAEEMFARFAVLDLAGTYRGVEP